jgi:hypothetical protein
MSSQICYILVRIQNRLDFNIFEFAWSMMKCKHNINFFMYTIEY